MASFGTSVVDSSRSVRRGCRLFGQAVRWGLSVDPIRVIAERVACWLGRRWPDLHVLQSLMFHVVASMGSRADTETRLAHLPGDARLVVTVRDYALRQLYFLGSRTIDRGWLYEPETTRLVMRWLRPGDTFVDVGANAGYYTAIAAARVGPSGRAYAFEPNPDIAALLKRTVDWNRFRGRVVVEDLAVTSVGAPVALYRSTNPALTGQTTTLPRTSQAVLPALTVYSVTLDGYVSSKRIQAIRLIKIDVEGAELDVLAGARQTLRSLRPQAVICEFCPEILADPSSTWLEVRAEMTSAGYQPWLIASDGSLSDFDGSMPSWKVGNICFLPVGG